MCFTRADQCLCDCHRGMEVAHCVPCCTVCPECRANVTSLPVHIGLMHPELLRTGVQGDIPDAVQEILRQNPDGLQYGP